MGSVRVERGVQQRLYLSQYNLHSTKPVFGPYKYAEQAMHRCQVISEGVDDHRR